MVFSSPTHEAFTELERGVSAALETYSNIHRGTGHYSQVTTALYERARNMVLDSTRLDKSRYVVIFCTPLRAGILEDRLKTGNRWPA